MKKSGQPGERGWQKERETLSAEEGEFVDVSGLSPDAVSAIYQVYKTALASHLPKKMRLAMMIRTRNEQALADFLSGYLPANAKEIVLRGALTDAIRLEQSETAAELKHLLKGREQTP